MSDVSETRFPPGWAGMDVHLCHDWLTGMRGGERCLEWLCRGFPRAPISTLVYNRASVSDTIRAHPVEPSCLGRIPGIARHYRLFLPLFPLAISRLRPAETTLLISTSHCAAKALRKGPKTRHLCYCFTPMRYAWEFQREYFAGKAFARALASPLLALLRRWDRRTAANVDRFVAISRHVRDRIARYYGREADVVYPPADTAFFTPGPAAREDADLMVSALVPYKCVDLALRAYAGLGRRLRIVGVGTERARLEALAGPRVEFLGWRSDEEIRELYRRSRLLVFPGEEDFGIVPVEAMACGLPVVAFARGGVTESVVDGETGVLFGEQTPEALREAVRRAAARPWNADRIRSRAEEFSVARFLDGIDRNIRACLGEAGV